MNKFVKSMSVVLVGTVMFASLVGCGSTKKDGNETGKDGGTKKIELSFMDWEGTEMNAKMMEAMKDFEKENPGVTVKQIPSPATDYGTKLNQMIAAKSAPDVFQAGHDMALQMSTKGTAYDFSKYADKDKEFTGGFYPGVYEQWVQKNKVVGLPGLLNCYGIFYNKDILKKANIVEPKEGWTWKELFDDAQKLSGTVNGVKTYGLYNMVLDPFRVSVLSVANGGQPFADQIQSPTKIVADSQFKAAVQTLQGYIKSGAIAPPTYKNDNMSAAFMQGKIPMMEYGQWGADDLIRNAPKNLNWGFVTTPKGDSKQAVVFDSVGWASPSSIKNPDAVWKLIKFMDTKMYEKVLPATPVAPTAYVASSQSYYDKLKSAGHQDISSALDYMLKTPTKLAVRFNTTWSGDANKFMGADWNNVLESKSNISSVDKMVDGINNVIKSNK